MSLLEQHSLAAQGAARAIGSDNVLIVLFNIGAVLGRYPVDAGPTDNVIIELLEGEAVTGRFSVDKLCCARTG